MSTAVLGAGVPFSVLISFLLVISLSMLLAVLFAPDSDKIADFYTGNRFLTPLQNALALAGDYFTPSTMVTTTALIALDGYDGFALAMSTALSMGVLLVLAQAMRNAGSYTLGDVLALRAPGAAPRIASAVATLAAAVPFLVVQLSGAGSIVALLLGHTDDGMRNFCTVLIGVLMVFFAVMSGMKGIGVLQIVKVPLTLGVMLIISLTVLSHFHWNPSAVLHAAGNGVGLPHYLSPGGEFGDSPQGWLNFVGLQLTVALSVCMPHIILRVNNSPNGIAARRSAHRAIYIVGALMLGVVFLGVGAAAMLGSSTITAVSPNGDASLLMLASHLYGGLGTTAGSTIFTIVASAMFVAVLAAVSDITLAAAAGLAHDLVAHAFKRDTLSQAGEVRTTQWSAIAVGALGIVLAVTSQDYNTDFLIIFAVAVAASTIFPALIYSLFWRRYNRAGLLWTVYGGLACSVGLQLFSPTVSGSAFAMFPHADFHFFPLQTPGLISVPAAFLLGWAGSARGRNKGGDPEVEARVLLGAAPDRSAD